jgi:hypothetical protein
LSVFLFRLAPTPAVRVLFSRRRHGDVQSGI